MNKESKLNLNAGDYAISHCDSDKTYNGLEVHRMLCDAYIAGNNDTLDDEDEKIRHYLMNFVKLNDGVNLPPDDAKKALAWLERQGEHANFRNKIQVGDKVTRNEDGVLVNLSQLRRVAKPREKQGEKKPLGYVHHIDEDGYYTKEAILEPNPYTGTGFDYNGHHWGMCARDGGVEILMDGNITSRVFPDKNNIIEQKPTDSYCQENCKGFQETGKCFADGECKAKREAEQKPADKIEPKFKVGDKIYLKPEYRMPDDDTPIANTVKEIKRIDDKHYRFDGSYIFIEDQDKYELVEQKPKENKENIGGISPNWSEEDERMFNSCCAAVAAADYYTLDDKQDIENWLKSLKERIGGKI